MKKQEIIYLSFFLLFSASILYLYTGSMMPGGANEVIVYVSHDQDYSEPVLKKFEEESGIKVKAVYDTEASKTVGLVNRLIAEKDRPQADVFWNNEATRTVALKNAGIIERYLSPNSLDKPAANKDLEGYWTGFAARARVIIYNTQLVKEAPSSINDLYDPRYKGVAGIANPLFGTTGSHAAAIYAVMGKDGAEDYFNKLRDNQVQVVESNGAIRDLVVSGQLYLGLTDTDDAYDAVLEGRSVGFVLPDQEEGDIGTLVIPNTVMLIKGASNPDNGKKLIDFLLSKEAEEMLAKSKARQIPLGEGIAIEGVLSVGNIRQMDASQEEIYTHLNESQEFLRGLFLT